jgi:HSP20 family protein
MVNGQSGASLPQTKPNCVKGAYNMAGLPTLWTDFDRTFHPASLRPLLRQIDDIFSDLFVSQGVSEEQEGARGANYGSVYTPPMHVEETADNYLLTVDLPGVAKEDLTIETQGGRLLISGERKRMHEQRTTNGYQAQRLYGRFQRSISLPEGVQGDQIEAHYRDGVLSVAVPKPGNLKATKVKIGEGRPGFFKSLLADKKGKEQGEPEADQVKLAN